MDNYIKNQKELIESINKNIEYTNIKYEQYKTAIEVMKECACDNHNLSLVYTCLQAMQNMLGICELNKQQIDRDIQDYQNKCKHDMVLISSGGYKDWYQCSKCGYNEFV